MIIGLTISLFDVWVGTTVSCIKTVIQWELGEVNIDHVLNTTHLKQTKMGELCSL